MENFLFFCLSVNFSACVIHWARQIKEVLSSQNAFETAENSGPLDEIEFWQNRCADLSGISKQLDKPGVKRVTHILELAKSSYVGPFLKLAGQIKVEFFLSLLEWENILQKLKFSASLQGLRSSHGIKREIMKKNLCPRHFMV